MKFLLGRKIGMTRVFDDRGAVRPVTVIQAGPCVVTQIKTEDKDGYNAVQIGFGATKRLTKPGVGHLKKSGLKTVRKLAELRLPDAAALAELAPGQVLDVTVFAPGDQVAVSGTSQGKGFAGVVRRHGFAGGPASHGSDFHRAPGAIGGRWPQRVVKGRRMAGHMGAERVTVKNLPILRVDALKHLLAIGGAIPGPRRGLVQIRG